MPASTSLAYVGLAVARDGDVDHGQVRHSLRMIRGQGERDGAAPVVARDRVPGEPQVLAQQLVDVGRDSPLVVAAGGPGRIAQTAQVRRETRPRAVGMLVQLRGSRLMDPAGLLPAIRALRLRRPGWTRRRNGCAHRSGTRLGRLGVAGSVWLLVQRSSARSRWRQRVRCAGWREQNRQKAVDATTELNEIIRSASLPPDR